MARSEPSVNLQWCESHVVLKAILANGTVLRLGTATLSNIPEEDSLQYSYLGKIMRDSQVKVTTTQSANIFNLDAENVDKELGLTINDMNSTLQGAKITASKVFSNIYSLDVNSFSPRIWYKANIRGTLPEEDTTVWQDLTTNNSDATGLGMFKWKKINGQHALQFDSARSMSIAGSFPLAQVFAVFKSDTTTFSGNGSILGSATTPFRFAGGTSQFASPFPTNVRSNGIALSSPYSLGDLTQTKIVNIKTNSPATVRSYFINNQDGVRINFHLSELVGFSNVLSSEQEQNIEYILSQRYGVELPYTPSRTWERKVLLVGQISGVEIDENIANIKIVSDISPNVAFVAARSVGTNCPLVFKGTARGYSGPLTTCNKIYISDGGCSGRENQHRFGGVVIEGELGRIIFGDVDTVIGDNDRIWGGGHYPELERHRELL